MDDLFEDLLSEQRSSATASDELALELAVDHAAAEGLASETACEAAEEAEPPGLEAAEEAAEEAVPPGLGGEPTGELALEAVPSPAEGAPEEGELDDLFEDLQASSSTAGTGVLQSLFGRAAHAPKAKGAAPRNKRSTEHGLYLNACKRAKASEREVEQRDTERAPVFSAWDQERLRAGNQMGAHHAYHKTGSQWTFHGVLRSAWLQLGGIKTLRHGGIDSLHNELDTVCAVAAAGGRAQTEFVQTSLAKMTAARDSTLVVQRFYDATPARVRFGQLQEFMEPIARYPLFDEETKRWTAVKLDQWRAASGRNHRMRWGTVEVLGQGLTVQQLTPGPSSVLEGFSIIGKPQVLQAANSSCIYAATESLCPELASKPATGLEALSRSCKMILLNELPDACKPNLRKKEQTAADTIDFPNVFSTNGTCGCHQAHRVVEGKEKWTVGNVYAIAFSCSTSALQRRLQAALKVFLQDLVFVRGEPSATNTRRNRTIMRHTFRRSGCTVAGVDTFDGPSAGLEEDLGEAAEEFLRLWNGDWNSVFPIHVCQGCCESREQAILLLFAAACKLDILQSSDCRLPSADDWGSCGQSCGRTSLGMLCHDVLGSVIVIGCPTWNEIGDMDLGDNDGEDNALEYRAKVQKKAWRSRCVLKDAVQRRQILLLCWLGAPIENLMSELQWLDRTKKGLLDIQLPDDPLNPFRRTRQRICLILREGRTGAMQPLYEAIPADAHPEFSSQARAMGLQFSAEVDWRFALYREYPAVVISLVRLA